MDFRELIVIHDVINRDVHVKAVGDFLVQVVFRIGIRYIRPRLRIHVIDIDKVLGKEPEQFHLHITDLTHIIKCRTFRLGSKALDGHATE